MPKLDLLKGTLPLLVLSVLREEELYGYEIAQRIRERSRDLFSPSEGSLYPALHRMEKRGWIDARWGQSDSNRRAKFYSLTRKGRAESAVQSENWQRVSGAVAQVLRLAAD